MQNIDVLLCQYLFLKLNIAVIYTLLFFPLAMLSFMLRCVVLVSNVHSLLLCPEVSCDVVLSERLSELSIKTTNEEHGAKNLGLHTK